MNKQSELLKGYNSENRGVVAGECDGNYPIAVFVRDRLPSDPHPQSEDDWNEHGMAVVEQVIEPGCEAYQRLVELGAPVLICANCPNLTD